MAPLVETAESIKEQAAAGNPFFVELERNQMLDDYVEIMEHRGLFIQTLGERIEQGASPQEIQDLRAQITHIDAIIQHLYGNPAGQPAPQPPVAAQPTREDNVEVITVASLRAAGGNNDNDTDSEDSDKEETRNNEDQQTSVEVAGTSDV